MYKWYKINGYKVFWNNTSKAIPYAHIEDIVSKSNGVYSWEEIPNAAIDWKYPLDEAILQSNQKDIPHYLKCSDGVNNFYFYFENINNVASEYKNEFYYDIIYSLDRYMTIYFNKLHILLNNHLLVNHLRRFGDRLEWTKDDEGNVSQIFLDIQKHKEFGQTTPITNNQMIRKYIYGTNQQQLWTDNFSNIPVPNNVEFKFFNDNKKTWTLEWDKFISPNKNGRYTYIVAKSSALQSGTSTQSKSFVGHAKNTKIIIPVFNELANDIMKGLNNFDITINQDGIVNALSDANFMGYFECDVPYSLWYGEAQNNKELEIKYGINKVLSSEEYYIPFIEMPVNYAPKWTIINYQNYNIGIDGKIRNLIKNIDKWNEDTEPSLLNPSYYQERCFIDNGKFISTDLSLIKYIYNPSEDIGMNLRAYMLFDNDLHIAYDYESYNNELNPLWNNKNSNVRSDIGTPSGVFGSASANYYVNNANTMTTSIDVLKQEQTMDWVNEGFSQAGNLTSTITSFATGNIIGGISKAIGTLFGTAQQSTQNAIKHMNQNKQLASQIHNIQSSANTLLSNPYVDAGIPNKNINGNTLFNTYSNELHPWDKTITFKYFLANGYPFNKVDEINKFNNRKYMNILQIDTTYNTDLIISTLKTQDKSLFSGLVFNYMFLEWLSNLHQVYNTLDIVNVYEPSLDSYLDNVEYELPIIQFKTNINTLITNTNFSYSTYNAIWKYITKLNPNLPDDLYENISITQYDNSITIKANPESEKYFGTITINCIKLPDSLTATHSIYLAAFPWSWNQTTQTGLGWFRAYAGTSNGKTTTLNFPTGINTLDELKFNYSKINFNIEVKYDSKTINETKEYNLSDLENKIEFVSESIWGENTSNYPNLKVSYQYRQGSSGKWTTGSYNWNNIKDYVESHKNSTTITITHYSNNRYIGLDNSEFNWYQIIDSNPHYYPTVEITPYGNINITLTINQ